MIKVIDHKKKPRVVVCPMEIAGKMMDLTIDFRAIGIRCTPLCLFDYPFADKQFYFTSEVKLFYWFVLKTRKLIAKNKMFKARLMQIPEMLVVIGIFIKTLLLYDAFIYIFDKSIFSASHYLRNFSRIEFEILKLFKKKIIFWHCGSDSRAPYCDGLHVDNDSEQLCKEVVRISEIVRIREKYGIVIDWPGSTHFHKKPFLNGVKVGRPLFRYFEKIERKSGNYQGIRIVHAPSHTCKGSNVIRTVISELKKDFNIEYIEISGKKNIEVMREMVNADIVIDQLYTDIPISRVAVEAAYLGVPVIMASYYMEEIKKYKEFLSGVVCYPEDLYRKLKELIENDKYREEIKLSEKKYIEDNFKVGRVAKIFMKIFYGQIDDKLLVIPNEGGAIYGAGCEKIEVEKKICKLIDTYGIESLGIPRNYKVFKEYERIYNEYRSNKKDG